jgi:hypothetical protein
MKIKEPQGVKAGQGTSNQFIRNEDDRTASHYRGNSDALPSAF